jgi:presenilin-like A22 family membrane protease
MLTSVAAAAALTLLLYKYPGWWLVDAVGILVSAGAIAIFGISFGILPALILLVALALYDSVSVYRTKHMISLADNVMQLRLPIMLIVPKHRGYSFLEESTHLKDDLAKGKKRDAMFMGLGDVVIPSILAVVAFHKGLDFATVGALAGTLLGFVFLMMMVLKGKAHAGLPSLNGGAILGFFLGFYADTQTFAFWTM